ncbi:nucleoside hydrolase-like domain-containing protein, partial [Enterococcus innesii]
MNNKARTIITTDGEVDDMNSFLRYLLYSDCFDTEGIVLTSSVYHYAGDPDKGIEPYRWTGSEWINDFID